MGHGTLSLPIPDGCPKPLAELMEGEYKICGGKRDKDVSWWLPNMGGPLLGYGLACSNIALSLFDLEDCYM